jgi:rhamnosyltransferase
VSEILTEEIGDTSLTISYFGLGENLGIAYAQNAGIEKSISEGADYILLLDQDSMPSANLAPHLLECILALRKTLPKIIAASPRYRDPRTGFSSLFMVSRFRIPYRYQPNQQVVPENIVLASFLISSGTLIDLKKLQELRGMRSDYFIDHVDTEWCLRAQSQGYKLIGVHDALMEHSLGERPRMFWFFGMRNVSEHTPLRDYYMFRNTIFTVKDSKAPIKLNFILLFRLIKYFFYFVVFAPNRMSRMTYMMLGIKHGIFNIDGRLNIDSKECESIPRAKLDP